MLAYILSPAISVMGTASEISSRSFSVKITFKAPRLASKFLILVVPVQEYDFQCSNAHHIQTSLNSAIFQVQICNYSKNFASLSIN